MARVDEASLLGCCWLTAFWGNALWGELVLAVWFVLVGKEVHTPLPLCILLPLGIDHDFWKDCRHCVHYMSAGS